MHTPKRSVRFDSNEHLLVSAQEAADLVRQQAEPTLGLFRHFGRRAAAVLVVHHRHEQLHSERGGHGGHAGTRHCALLVERAVLLRLRG